MRERIGEYSRTFTGRKFYPLDPDPEDVAIEDIARHLAMQCRFNGGLNHFYSVAQHSCLVADTVFMLCKNPITARWGLLHDASEAYTGDIVRPLKRAVELQVIRYIESKIMLAIVHRFGLEPEDEPKIVEEVDARICINEARDLRTNPEGTDVLQVREGYSPLPELSIEAWPWERAEKEFLERFWSGYPVEP